MDLDFIIASFIVGSLLLLSFLHLTNTTAVNKKANIYFGIFLFLWSTFWLDDMVIPPHYFSNTVFVAFLRIIQFLVPVTFYLSVRFYTNPYFKYSFKDVKYLITPGIFLIILLNKSFFKESTFNLINILFSIGHALFYIVSAYTRIQKHKKDIELFSSETESIDLKWIQYIIYSFISTALLITGYNFFFIAENLNIYINIYLLLNVYLVAYYSIKQKEIYPRGFSVLEIVSQEGEHKEDVQKKLMNEIELNNIKVQLIKLMEEEESYLDRDLNLVKLADKLHITGHQLSYVLNNGFDENFFNFINKYRVKKAQELLLNPKYNHLNMIAIGYEAGFNSKTAFNTTFKKITSTTPTEYKNTHSEL